MASDAKSYSTVSRHVKLDFHHQVFFTHGAFRPENTTLLDVLSPQAGGEPHQANKKRVKAIVYVDKCLTNGSHISSSLLTDIANYFESHKTFLHLVTAPIALQGGEECKNDWSIVEGIWKNIHDFNLCRHSYVVIVGGGATIDMVGFAAATAHRGVRLVRLPTTTLSQGDGGVGVKNGVNFFGKKNWVGSFTVPDAVVNDAHFLQTLPVEHKRAGYSEAIKVSLIKDKNFFEEIESSASDLAKFVPEAMERLIRRSAELHLDHIANNGDPFEKGSARPLDFGHWVAHKIEAVSNFRIGHGHAVAIGLAVDITYCALIGMLPQAVADRCLGVLRQVGFPLYDPVLHEKTPSTGNYVVLDGLEEFREHLGGELTITLIDEIGHGVEVHEMDHQRIVEAINILQSKSA